LKYQDSTLASSGQLYMDPKPELLVLSQGYREHQLPDSYATTPIDVSARLSELLAWDDLT
jgi:hypothetical protein